MSNRQVFLPFAIIVITVVIPFIFVAIFLEMLGVGQYVWPIMGPILLFTVILVCIIGGGVSLVVRSAQRRAYHLSSRVQAGYQAQMFTTGDYVQSYSSGATYEIPVYCPQCQESIELNRVHWIGPMDLTCPSCLSSIHIRVSEK